MERVRVLVKGTVQGVGFRWSTRRIAATLGLGGWVRNTAEGNVEIEAMGDADRIEDLLRWCAQGPEGARVSAVDVLERGPIPPRHPGSFAIL